MKYEIPNKETGYLPEVIATLNSISSCSDGYKELGLNHPVDIFYFSFIDVIDCIYRLTNRFNNDIYKKKNNIFYEPEDLDEYSLDIFNLIFFSANFIESCQSIIKSIFNEDRKKFTKVSREFKKTTKSYRAHVSKIINEIKHKHRRVRPFSASWDNNIIIGYYIEGVLGDNTLGPDPLIHNEFNGMRTGFSLNRDLPYHLINLYYVSAVLNSLLRRHSKVRTGEFKLIEIPKLKKLLEKLSELPLLLLPNEMEMNTPFIKNINNQKFILELPSRRKIENRQRHLMNISLSQRIGIRSRSFSPSYLPRLTNRST